MTKPKTDLLDAMEKGIRDVLENKDATAEQKIQAINAGSKLLQIKHKIAGESDEPGSFFNKK